MQFTDRSINHLLPSGQVVLLLKRERQVLDIRVD